MSLSPLKRISSIHIAVLLSLVTVVWLVSGAVSGADEQIQDTIQDDGNLIASVRVYSSTAVETPKIIETMGQTKASRQVVLMNEISGKILEKAVPEGAIVKKGDIILKLTTEDRGALLRRAEKNFEQKKIEFDSAKELAKKGYVSNAALAEKKGDMDEAEASLKRARLNLENTVITAPFDSVVDEYHVEEGDIAPIGRQLVTVLDLRPIEVVAYVSENDIRDITVGQTAHVTFLDGKQDEMKVTYVAAKADAQTRTFLIKLSKENEDLSILAGMTTSIVIPTSMHKSHFIPTSVLTLNPDGVMGVKVIDENNLVAFYPVSLVTSTDKGLWINGLPDTADIIVVGQEFVKVGASVKIHKVDSPFLVQNKE